MPDYAGAKQAMRDRFANAWTQTRITYQNETPAAPWPPVNASNELVGWCNLEILSSGSELAATGMPGNRLWRYEGSILIHHFEPVGSADALATERALASGEIFRAASFYEGPGGRRVRTLTPSIDDIDSGDDSGNWTRCTMSVDFTYWHRG